MWNFDVGVKMGQEVMTSIATKINRNPTLIKNIMIFGGEPLDTPFDDLVRFLRFLKTFRLPIWLFTRYSIEVIPVAIRDLCDYIKTGEYEEELTVEGYEQYGMELATSNQKILKKGEDYDVCCGCECGLSDL